MGNLYLRIIIPYKALSQAQNYIKNLFDSFKEELSPHITLIFFGIRSKAQTKQIAQRLSEIITDLRVNRSRVHHPGNIQLQLEPIIELFGKNALAMRVHDIHGELDNIVMAIGLKLNQHEISLSDFSFKPHVTLGRVEKKDIDHNLLLVLPEGYYSEKCEISYCELYETGVGVIARYDF